jgi:hypothetical protein
MYLGHLQIYVLPLLDLKLSCQVNELKSFQAVSHVKIEWQETHIHTYCGIFAQSICETSREPLLGNGSANLPVARQWLSSHHMMATTHVPNRRAVGSGVFCAICAEAI